MWCAVAADAAAGLVGGVWQRARVDAVAAGGGAPDEAMPRPKSWPGTVAALVVAFGGARVLGAFSLPASLAIAVTAAAAERWGPGDDNLRVAVAAGLVALYFAGGLAALG